MKHSRRITPFHIIIFGVILFAVVEVVYDNYYSAEHHCKETSQQRFRNWGDKLVVENKFVCDNGEVRWKI